MKTDVGMLYVCATPIGNMGDITLRVLETLKSVDLIAAEDTRHSRALLTHFDIHTPLTSYHEHNKYEKAEELLDVLRNGKNIALISDAGTPVISDPGEVLVRRCREEGLPVTSLPGACALITGLSMSGMDARRFAFEGFLPTDKKEREEALTRLAGESRTSIIYEAPHHLKKTLALLLAAIGDRKITLCRELTKIHEEALDMTISEAIAYYEIQEPRGEYVIIIEGAAPVGKTAGWEEMSLEDHLQYYLNQGIDKKEAMKLMARDRGTSKRDIYQGLL
ncbi:MAG: 16S rRNA (cytidine(1402)-2'-O)-methyltransferase [Lachnospiraceae bacterium]|nr:16S rRNA (cytidine(1402)-2'-O)-methyltransferase [Candidatus Minthocola equi]